jgi:thiol:disulfide interchange protein DsbG
MDLSGVGATDVKTRVRMIVFFDADCPYCATLWSRLRTAATIRGVRWIPVPYFDSSSLGREASILLANDPVAALDTNFRLYDRTRSLGAAVALPDVPAAVISHLQANAAFWANLGAMTPLILYRKRTGEPYCFYGLPDDEALARILADLAAEDIDPFVEPGRRPGEDSWPRVTEDTQP